MAKSPEDASAMKLVRTEFGRRLVDTSQADIRVLHGICTVRGVLKPMRGGPGDMKAEVDTIAKVLRQRNGIRDVIMEVTLRSG